MIKRPQVRRAAVVELILSATLEELGASGFGALAVDRIAERAGVNKTTIYRRWPTKRELVAAALHAKGHTALPTPDTGDVASDLSQLLSAGAAFMSSPLGAAVVRTRLSEGHDPEFATVLAGPERYEARVRAVLGRAVDRGQVSADADLDTVVAILVGAMLFRRFVDQRVVSPAFVRRLLGHAMKLLPG